MSTYRASVQKLSESTATVGLSEHATGNLKNMHECRLPKARKPTPLQPLHMQNVKDPKNSSSKVA